jgi:hypothetical protein
MLFKLWNLIRLTLFKIKGRRNMTKKSPARVVSSVRGIAYTSAGHRKN